MKLGIVGARAVPREDVPLEDGIARAQSDLKRELAHIISGGANGVDTYVEQWAREHEFPFTLFPPQLRRYGADAYRLRNLQIVRASDAVLAFPILTSRGTRMTIGLARASRVPVLVCELQPPRRPRWQWYMP